MRPVPRSTLPAALLVSLAAAAPAHAAITVTTTSAMSFGDQPTFSLGVPRAVVFHADADTLNPVRAITSPEWVIASDGCTGDRLLAGESCTLQLRFSPYKRGHRTGRVELVARDVTSSPVTLTGTGTGPLRGKRGKPGDPARITCTVKRKTKLGAKLKITCAVKFSFAKKSSRAHASMAVAHRGRTLARGHERVSLTVRRPGTYRARATVDGHHVSTVVRVRRAG